MPRVDERELRSLLLQAVALAALADAIIHRCESMLGSDEESARDNDSSTVDALRRSAAGSAQAQSAGDGPDAGEDLIASRVVFNKQKPSTPPTVPEIP